MTVDYGADGFAVWRSVLSKSEAASIVEALESGIVGMAAELGVAAETYLNAVCRWSTPNPVVEEAVDRVRGRLSADVSQLVGRPAAPSRASAFRKSTSASHGTHGHQDASYWVGPSARRYDLTTWVALDDMDGDSGALVFRPGSHRGPVSAPVDYLRPDFEDPAAGWTDAVTVPVHAGDVVVFHPHVWHASHGMESNRVRRGLAVRWVGDPPLLSTDGQPLNDPGMFGMYTSGALLVEALASLGVQGERDHGLEAIVRRALETHACSRLPEPRDANRALERLLLHLRAVRSHHAADQRGMVWDAVRDAVVLPTAHAVADGDTRSE